MKGKTVGIILLILILSGLLAVTSAGIYAWWQIIHAPGKEISQENIKQILAVESPVYYSDGHSKIGVFFENAHRQYVPYDMLPKNFINAIIAAEDQNFFSHHGLDFPGILRALMANIRAGRVIQGGSTITQQTAKNLFKRKNRSIRAKLKEMLFALRLEYHYPKEKILEFYANQFYVSGNGHGLGVAARYYFDKKVDELGLVECAFIAGSVKRPNYYNPFIKKTRQAVLKTQRRAKSRTAYVLKQMRQAGMITKAQFKEAMSKKIPFHPGKMFFANSVLLDLIKDFLETPEMEERLADNGIENIATSGIRIFTTVDKAIQKRAEPAIKSRLSELAIRLTGYDHAEIQKRYNALPSLRSGRISVDGFAFARVTSITKTAAPTVDIQFVSSNKTARIDTKGLMHVVTPLVKWQKNRWSEATPQDLTAFLDRMQVGDLVYVRVREIDPVFGITCVLEKYPRIQGAVVVLQNGLIRAMVGGSENRFYNRAVHAKRPMGSIFKPFVYAAAIQLGWSPLDMLNNTRNLFVYQRMPYFPRPDHHSPHDRVSMSWAGVKSENLATIWLLYHLTDQLTPGQFQEVVDHIGLGRSENDGYSESYSRYAARIRDELGVLVDENALRKAAYQRAVKIVEPDLVFAGKLEEMAVLKELHYGQDFQSFRDALDKAIEEKKEALAAAGSPAQGRDIEKALKELTFERSLLDSSYRDFVALQERLLKMDISGGYGPAVSPWPETAPGWNTGATTGQENQAPVFFYKRRQSDTIAFSDLPLDPENWERMNTETAASFLATEDATGMNTILLRGTLSVATIKMIQKQATLEFNALKTLPPYSPEVLRDIQDFRIAVGLTYLVKFCHALGIKSTLEPVLSFPLGSNVVSLLETARATQSLMLGKRLDNTSLGGTGTPHPGHFLIDRIESRDGTVIYTPRHSETRVLDPVTTATIRDILRNTVTFGTGRFARENVRMTSNDPKRKDDLAQLDLEVPLFGKTGTANNYTNAAFTGYLPGVHPETGAMHVKDGYTVTAYVGFDDNTPMKRGTTHITGAAGALPLWTDVVNAILAEKKYDTYFDLIDLAFKGSIDMAQLSAVNGLRRIVIDTQKGGLPRMTEAEKRTVGYTTPGILAPVSVSENNEIIPVRRFSPLWKSATSKAAVLTE